MTKKEAIELLHSQQEIFEVARLVNVSRTAQFVPNETDDDFVEEHYSCYAVWNKEHRCENCISARAFADKGKYTKFEFIDKDVYHVVAKYIEVEDVPYVLELVTNITDKTLFGAYGKEEFVDTIKNYNNTLYIDSLTKAYNRNYYEEQLKSLSGVSAMAMMDMDHFKEINDGFGHEAGDRALAAAAACAMSRIRSSDTVIRYGGDEFLIIFHDISKEIFIKRLEEIRAAIECAVIAEYPEVKLSVSIGGYFCEGIPNVTVKDADDMLYEAKSQRNTVRVK